MLSKALFNSNTYRCALQVSSVSYKSTDAAAHKKKDPRSRFRERAHTNSVMVQNINWAVSKEDLHDHFSQYASIDYINYPVVS